MPVVQSNPENGGCAAYACCFAGPVTAVDGALSWVPTKDKNLAQKKPVLSKIPGLFFFK